MSISSVGSSDSNWGAVRERAQSFRSGQSNISKDELKKIKDEFGDQNPASKLYDDYDKVDVNGDGVSFDELQTYAKANKASFQGQGRSQGPGPITKEQLTEMRDEVGSSDDSEMVSSLDKLIQNFDSADTNKDGSISLDEMESYGEANGFPQPPDGPPLGGDPRGGGGHGPKDMTKDELVAMKEMIASTDITAAGNLDKLINNFDSTDTDGDGKISIDEFKTFADANGISIPPPPHHSNATTTDDSGDDSESSDKTDTASALSAMIQSLLQRYSQPETDYSSLLSGVTA